ncbi:MAG: MBL fold metallo-hydrolase [Dehalococcoidia bacterium]
MEITWLGRACFALKGSKLTIVTDPLNDAAGGRLDIPPADIITFSHLLRQDQWFEEVRAQRKVLRGPGEYEISGVFLTGIKTYRDAHPDQVGTRGANTIYRFKLDGVHVCHLGALAHLPTSDHVSAIGDVDVLLVPLGGDTLSPTAASETVGLLEPRVIIPMPQGPTEAGAAQDTLARFFKELGVPATDPVPRYTVTASTLGTEPRVVLLQLRD